MEMERQVKEALAKSPGEEVKRQLADLKKENEELKRQLALCALCNHMCTPQQHGKRLAELKKDRDSLDNFIHSIGKREKQTHLRTHFLSESKKHEAGFNGQVKLVQHTLEIKTEKTVTECKSKV